VAVRSPSHRIRAHEDLDLPLPTVLDLPGTLHNWRAMRIGPAFVKLGKSILYPVEELDAWDKKNMVACRASPGNSVRRYTTFPIV
jgi:hypothetical protein